ncbi:MAG: AAA domain-containing protein, partial [Gammaproteobacteria bacterium]
MELFKDRIDCIEPLPKALLALLTDPSTAHREPVLPAFRGLSKIYGSDRTEPSGIGAIQELYFPDAFNDEQVQIVQKLQVYDGVVVQGPPGTGKTHTIANIICHYLALGQRVLVTSMKEPALTVLKDKLPDRIQSLAISLLTTERDGMRQFEHSIAKIASEVQTIDRLALGREIVQIKAAIDICHARLARTDAQISEWAMKNLRLIDLDGEQIETREAADEVAACNNILRLEDPISAGPEYRPLFTDDDIARLRKIRKSLGQDLDYLAARLPQLSDFPESRELLRTHRDLSRHRELQSQIEAGDVPPLGDSSDATLEAAQTLFEQIAALKELRRTVENSAHSWTAAMLSRLRKERTNEILDLFDSLAEALDREIAKRRQFLAKPVELGDDGDDRNEILLSAIQRCAEGKTPFGITGLLVKNTEKNSLKAIRIDGHPPVSAGDWRHILDFVYHRRSLRTLITRWNNLAVEFALPSFPAEPSQAAVLFENLGHYRNLDALAALEHDTAAKAHSVCPSWPQPDRLAGNDEALNQLQGILRHHLTQNRLSETWAVKERFQQILSGCTGRITLSIKEFIDQSLGNPAVNDAELQAHWSALMEELSRIQGRGRDLETVNAVTGLIADSGAPRWAERLRSEPVTTQADALLPDDWGKCWRINRLANYLNAIDSRAELKQLAAVRSSLEDELARSYREAVAKQTWLKLAENASPSVKSALQAYLAAIKKIGKRKGKRVPLYQRQAREAAALAGPTIPCWIMPHYRISESLPAEFGSFDLVIIDEASQSDLSALPAIFRASKILVVGDDKQVSPEGAFLDTEAVQNLVQRYLINQFPLYRDQMTPERSIYDLFRVVFADSATMLKEHFRCVAPIIEYSKREVYKHELKPLRIPKASERLDPPLIDVVVEDGRRKTGEDINRGEAAYIVNEIKAIVRDPKMADRTIGVVSTVCGAVAAAMIFASVLITCQLIWVRFVLNQSTIWQTEAVIYL